MEGYEVEVQVAGTGLPAIMIEGQPLNKGFVIKELKEEVTNNNIIFSGLAPQTDYVVILRDVATGTEVSEKVTTPVALPNEKFRITKTHHIFSEDGRTYGNNLHKKAKKEIFDVEKERLEADIISWPNANTKMGREYAVYFKVYYMKKTENGGEMEYVLVMEAPNGEIYTNHFTHTYSGNFAGTEHGHAVAFTGVFSAYYEKHQSIDTGEYTFKLYRDDEQIIPPHTLLVH